MFGSPLVFAGKGTAPRARLAGVCTPPREPGRELMRVFVRRLMCTACGWTRFVNNADSIFSSVTLMTVVESNYWRFVFARRQHHAPSKAAVKKKKLIMLVARYGREVRSRVLWELGCLVAGLGFSM